LGQGEEAWRFIRQNRASGAGGRTGCAVPLR